MQSCLVAGIAAKLFYFHDFAQQRILKYLKMNKILLMSLYTF